MKRDDARRRFRQRELPRLERTHGPLDPVAKESAWRGMLWRLAQQGTIGEKQAQTWGLG